MTINERMNHIIKELYGGNKRAFANAIGVSATVIENVVGTRQGKPSYDVLEKVCANANISAEWLLMERGEMLYNSTSQTQYTPCLLYTSPSPYQHIKQQYMLISIIFLWYFPPLKTTKQL